MEPISESLAPKRVPYSSGVEPVVVIRRRWVLLLFQERFKVGGLGVGFRERQSDMQNHERARDGTLVLAG